jgi:hypothetical protein
MSYITADTLPITHAKLIFYVLNCGLKILWNIFCVAAVFNEDIIYEAYDSKTRFARHSLTKGVHNVGPGQN